MAGGTLKRCPSCGKFFTCMGDSDCWCEHYQVPKKGMVKIMNTYKDCICPDCLGKYAEK
ncbi:MAG: cysteine-rich CWC family protein [Bacteroidales bacterium]|nr:cysteine-rich CWC family protein [Bacteroidales bacterium]